MISKLFQVYRRNRSKHPINLRSDVFLRAWLYVCGEDLGRKTPRRYAESTFKVTWCEGWAKRRLDVPKSEGLAIMGDRHLEGPPFAGMARSSIRERAYLARRRLQIKAKVTAVTMNVAAPNASHRRRESVRTSGTLVGDAWGRPPVASACDGLIACVVAKALPSLASAPGDRRSIRREISANIACRSVGESLDANASNSSVKYGLRV